MIKFESYLTFNNNNNKNNTVSYNKKLDYFVFIVSPVDGYRNMLKLSCRPLIVFPSFFKNKKISGLSLPVSISA